MNFKYKKAILFTVLSTMGIGVLTLSISNEKSQANDTKDHNKTVAEASLLKEDDSNITPTVTPSPTPIPSPTPFPVYSIEEEGIDKIQTMFKKFYHAKNEGDVEVIKGLLSDPTQVESKDEMKKKTQYIEEYRNIKTYAKKGFEEGSYIVYVYHEIKFTGIKTPAPSLSKFYLITDGSNKLKIFSDELDELTQEYYNERNMDEDVVKLIDMTNDKSKEAMKADKDLKNFWDNVSQLAKDSKEDNTKKASKEDNTKKASKEEKTPSE